MMERNILFLFLEIHILENGIIHWSSCFDTPQQSKKLPILTCYWSWAYLLLTTLQYSPSYLTNSLKTTNIVYLICWWLNSLFTLITSLCIQRTTEIEGSCCFLVNIFCIYKTLDEGIRMNGEMRLLFPTQIVGPLMGLLIKWMTKLIWMLAVEWWFSLGFLVSTYSFSRIMLI